MFSIDASIVPVTFEVLLEQLNAHLIVLIWIEQFRIAVKQIHSGTLSDKKLIRKKSKIYFGILKKDRNAYR